MTEKQANKVLADYKKSLEELIPERKKQIGLLWLCLKEILEELMYKDKTKLPRKALSKRSKRELNFDNILAICNTSVDLSRKNNLEDLSTALAYMDVSLFQIHSDIQNARRKISSIRNNIGNKLSDKD